MILSLNEREEVTLKHMNEIKSICDGILRRFEHGSTKFLVEDVEDIKNYLNFIAEDVFNRKSDEW